MCSDRTLHCRFYYSTKGKDCVVIVSTIIMIILGCLLVFTIPCAILFSVHLYKSTFYTVDFNDRERQVEISQIRVRSGRIVEQTTIPYSSIHNITFKTTGPLSVGDGSEGDYRRVMLEFDNGEKIDMSNPEPEEVAFARCSRLSKLRDRIAREEGNSTPFRFENLFL